MLRSKRSISDGVWATHTETAGRKTTRFLDVILTFCSYCQDHGELVYVKLWCMYMQKEADSCKEVVFSCNRFVVTLLTPLCGAIRTRPSWLNFSCWSLLYVHFTLVSYSVCFNTKKTLISRALSNDVYDKLKATKHGIFSDSGESDLVKFQGLIRVMQLSFNHWHPMKHALIAITIFAEYISTQWRLIRHNFHFVRCLSIISLI